MKSYTDHSPSSLDTIHVFFQRAYITISINPHYLSIGKNAIFDLDYPSLYHMFIFFAFGYIYDGVLYDYTSRFHRFFTHKQTCQSELQND